MAIRQARGWESSKTESVKRDKETEGIKQRKKKAIVPNM
jgi:hypothetical protein